MNTLFHSLVENKREKENIASVSKIEAQNYLCPGRQVCWTRLLRLARFYYDSLGTLTPLEICSAWSLSSARQLLSARQFRLAWQLSSVRNTIYLCPVRQVRLAWQLCLARLYFDLLGTFALLTGLRCSVALCQAVLRSTTSLGPQLKGNFPPLFSFAPRGPCPALGSFLK